MRLHLILWTLLVGSLPRLGALTVVAYNVENLFDGDGVAMYEDYQPDRYTPAHLVTKVRNIAGVLARAGEGAGPDIAIFNEIELDQRSDEGVGPEGWGKAFAGRKLEDLLKPEGSLDPDVAGLPAEAWLLKACEEAGLKGYHVASSDEKPGDYESGRPRAVRNVIFSRFPIRKTRTLETPNARGILEVVLDVEGHPLTVFANHWKSGAGDPEAEGTRRENARTLRARLDEIFAADPAADVIIAGDLNSHYNQNRRYREMKETGINDVLGSQGNELALRSGKDLYNLWFELPSNNRGSDIYQNEWGTLMHLIVSRGLYDKSGVQYVDNSFLVLKIPGLNADVFGRPVRWSRGRTPAGFSDHFPISAEFRIAGEGDKAAWMPLSQPSRTESGSGHPVPVETSLVDLFQSAVEASGLPAGTDLRDGACSGRVLCVRDAPAAMNDRGHVDIELLGQSYNVFTHDKRLRSEIRKRVSHGGKLSFYGELGTYKDRWQFLIHGPEWLVPPAK